MSGKSYGLLAMLVAAVLMAPPWDSPLAQEAEREAWHAAARAVVSMIQSSGDDELRRFIADHLSDKLRGSTSAEELLTHVREIRSAGSAASGVDLELSPDGLRVVLSGARPATILVGFETEAPHKISALSLEHRRPAGATLDGAEAAMRVRVRAIEGLAGGGGDTALRKFADEHLAQSYRESVAEAELFELLRAIRRASAGAGSMQAVALALGMGSSGRDRGNRLRAILRAVSARTFLRAGRHEADRLLR